MDNQIEQYKATGEIKQLLDGPTDNGNNRFLLNDVYTHQLHYNNLGQQQQQQQHQQSDCKGINNQSLFYLSFAKRIVFSIGSALLVSVNRSWLPAFFDLAQLSDKYTKPTFLLLLLLLLLAKFY